MQKSNNKIVRLCLTFLLFILSGKFAFVTANPLPYKISLSPMERVFVVKPNFDHIEAEMSLENSGDDVVLTVKTSEKTDSLKTVIYYLDESKEWSLADKSILLKANRVIELVAVTQPKKKLDDATYNVKMHASFAPVYTPLSDKVLVKIEPQITADLFFLSSSTNSTKRNVRIPIFGSRNGKFQFSGSPLDLAFMVQNLDKYPSYVSGEIIINKDNHLSSIPISPILINPNSQINVLDHITGKKIFDNLSTGIYEINTRLRLKPDDLYSIFASTHIVVLPHTATLLFVVAIVTILIIFLVINLSQLKKNGRLS
jgi:hypothetical protein